MEGGSDGEMQNYAVNNIKDLPLLTGREGFLLCFEGRSNRIIRKQIFELNVTTA